MLAIISFAVIFAIMAAGYVFVIKFRKSHHPAEPVAQASDVMAGGVWYLRGRAPITLTGFQYAALFKTGQLRLSKAGDLELSDDGKRIFKELVYDVTMSPTSSVSGFTITTPKNRFVILLDNPYYPGRESAFAAKYRRWRRALKLAGARIKWLNLGLD